jgi:hypothetical protein
MRRPVDAQRVRAFMQALGAEADRAGHVYFTGGVTAVLTGWRGSTIDIDLKLEPDSDRLLRAIALLKERLEINVELAAPDQFIPELSGWRERSPWISREGSLDFHHYDYCAQALAKIERGHAQDRGDVSEILARGLVSVDELRRRFAEIEPLLHRFPAIDPASFRRGVEDAATAAELRARRR